MKKTVYFLLFCLVSFSAHSQVVAIQNDRHNVLYIGVDNLITVAVQECPYDSIQVSTDFGELVKRDRNHYLVNVDTPGTAAITVKKKKGKNEVLLNVRRFHVEYLPDPTPLYAKKKGGEISIAEMDENFAPYAKLIGFEQSPRYTIDSFTIMAVRGNQMLLMKRQAGGRKMDDTVTSFFKILHENDKLLFTDITCRTAAPEKRLLHLHAMEFVIKNTTVTVNGEKKEE